MTRPPSPMPQDVDAAAFWRWVWRSVYPALGYVLVVAGFVVIGVSWWEVANTAVVAKQVPFIVSGGLVGLGLIVVGGRFLMMNDLERDSGRLDRLEQMVMDLHETLLAVTEGDFGDYPAEEQPARRNGAQGYLAVPGGHSFHLPGCPMLEGKGRTTTLKPETIARRGLEPCPICEPGDVLVS